jgi:hypothetical protein
MVKTAMRYGTILIGMYLVGSLATGYGKLMKPTAAAGRTLVRTFQGK